MRKGERRISHLQTQHWFWQRTFCKSSTSRSSPRKMHQALHPQYLRGDAQPADRNGLVSAYCHQEVLNMFMSHPRKMCNCMTWDRKHFRSKRKKTTLQTGKETSETSKLGQESKLFPQIPSQSVTSHCLIIITEA